MLITLGSIGRVGGRLGQTHTVVVIPGAQATLSVDELGITEDTTPTIFVHVRNPNGSTDGLTVQVYLNDVLDGTTTTDAAGDAEYTFGTLAAGNYTIRAQVPIQTVASSSVPIEVPAPDFTNGGRPCGLLLCLTSPNFTRTGEPCGLLLALTLTTTETPAPVVGVPVGLLLALTAG